MAVHTTMNMNKWRKILWDSWSKLDGNQRAALTKKVYPAGGHDVARTTSFSDLGGSVREEILAHLLEHPGDWPLPID